ncbi:hypothetical protein MRX96_028496 [Rhipicephalus microplus]
MCRSTSSTTVLSRSWEKKLHSSQGDVYDHGRGNNTTMVGWKLAVGPRQREDGEADIPEDLMAAIEATVRGLEINNEYVPLTNSAR